MSKSMCRSRRTPRRRFAILPWLATGVLANHLSCSRIVQDSLGDGTSLFLTSTTADVLSFLLRPDWLNGGTVDDTNVDGGDPFAPPVQS